MLGWRTWCSIAFSSLWYTANSISDTPSAKYNAARDRGAQGKYPIHSFRSSKLQAPKTNFAHWSPDCEDGSYYFITPRGWSVEEPGPMILDGSGDLVWTEHFANEFGGQAYDLKIQQYKGEDFLTFWTGDDTVRGHGQGHFYMLNASYNIVYRLGAANGLRADLHELQITPEGTALLLAYQIVPMDVRPAGRIFSDVWNQAIWDCVVQEVDVETGDLLFQWRASEHINITHSYNKIEDLSVGTQQSPFEPYHLNSVQKDAAGNYLISARNTHAIYYINGQDSTLIWTLGGPGNDFADLSDGHALNFAWQHDARFVDWSLFPSLQPPQSLAGFKPSLLMMFDNAAVDWDYFYGQSTSRGLLLELHYPDSKPRTPIPRDSVQPTDTTATKLEPLSKADADKIESINGSDPAYGVRVVQQYTNARPNLRSGTQGSVQVIPPTDKTKDAQVFVGYGLNAVMTEYTSRGLTTCDIHFAAETSWEKGDVQSYRAYKLPWVGRPHTPPDISTKGGQISISWNGATEVQSWTLQAKDGQSKEWIDVLDEPRQGFETTLWIPLQYRHARWIRVRAVCHDEQLCDFGTSRSVARGRLESFLSQHVSDKHFTSARWLVLLLGAACGTTLAYIVLLRLLSWRHGRPHAGAS